MKPHPVHVDKSLPYVTSTVLDIAKHVEHAFRRLASSRTEIRGSRRSKSWPSNTASVVIKPLPMDWSDGVVWILRRDPASFALDAAVIGGMVVSTKNIKARGIGTRNPLFRLHNRHLRSSNSLHHLCCFYVHICLQISRYQTYLQVWEYKRD
jgi:hypothetical protein